MKVTPHLMNYKNKPINITDIREECWAKCDTDRLDALKITAGNTTIAFKDRLCRRYHNLMILSPTLEYAEQWLLEIFNGHYVGFLITQLQVAKETLNRLKDPFYWSNLESFKLDSGRNVEASSIKVVTTKGKTTSDEVTNTKTSETTDIVTDIGVTAGASDDSSMLITSESTKEEKDTALAIMNPREVGGVIPPMNNFQQTNTANDSKESRAGGELINSDTGSTTEGNTQTSNLTTSKTGGDIVSNKLNLNLATITLKQISVKIPDIERNILEAFSPMFGYTPQC